MVRAKLDMQMQQPQTHTSSPACHTSASVQQAAHAFTMSSFRLPMKLDGPHHAKRVLVQLLAQLCQQHTFLPDTTECGNMALQFSQSCSQ